MLLGTLVPKGRLPYTECAPLRPHVPLTPPAAEV